MQINKWLSIKILKHRLCFAFRPIRAKIRSPLAMWSRRQPILSSSFCQQLSTHCLGYFRLNAMRQLVFGRWSSRNAMPTMHQVPYLVRILRTCRTLLCWDLPVSWRRVRHSMQIWPIVPIGCLRNAWQLGTQLFHSSHSLIDCRELLSLCSSMLKSSIQLSHLVRLYRNKKNRTWLIGANRLFVDSSKIELFIYLHFFLESWRCLVDAMGLIGFLLVHNCANGSSYTLDFGISTTSRILDCLVILEWIHGTVRQRLWLQS